MNIFAIAITFLIALIMIGLLTFGVLNLIAAWRGAPYVPSKRKIIYRAFQNINLRPKSIFIDMGCGDGYIVRYVAKQFGVSGIGIDTNPLLVAFAKLVSFMTGTAKLAQFKTQDLFRANITKADYIFVYLMPSLLKRLAPKFLEECKPDALIISNAFAIPQLEKYLIQTIPTGATKVFVYQIQRKNLNKENKTLPINSNDRLTPDGSGS